MFWYVFLFIVGAIVFVKAYTRLTVGIYKGRERLDGKTVIVTGASAGIGKECAKGFAKRGARVVMLCRDMVKGERVRSAIIQETGNHNISLRRVDFADLASVRQCANEILKEEARIDVLLNNAAIGEVAHEITKDGMHIVMQSNHFGPFLFTNILLGKIRQSAPSRILNVSSCAYRLSQLDFNNLNDCSWFDVLLYSRSKLANIYFTTHLAHLLKRTGVTVNCLNPGFVMTEIFRGATSARKLFIRIACSLFGKSLWEGTQTQMMLCVSDSVKNVTGEYFKDCKILPLSPLAQDENKAALLWTLSEKAVGLRDNEKHYA